MGTVAKYLGGVLDIVPAFRPVDLQTAANDGDYVSLRNHEAVIFLFHSAIGTAGDDPTLTLTQATSAAGGSAKNLAVADTIYTKQAATNLLSVGVWTKVTQTAGATYTEATSAEQEALWAVEVHVDQLDITNGFYFVRCSVADIGSNAQLGAAYYILCGPKHPSAPEHVLSPL